MHSSQGWLLNPRDDTYSQFTSLIFGGTGDARNTPKRRMRSKANNHSKRRKRYVLRANTKRNPRMLAKFIKGLPCLGDQDPSVPSEAIRTFYTGLWGSEFDVTIPFNSTPPAERQNNVGL